MKPKELSAWTMKELIEMIRTTQLSLMTKELEDHGKKELDIDILFEKTDVVVADPIFLKSDEEPLPSLFKDEAGDVVQHINGGEKVAGIDRQALRKWLVDAVVERRSLAQTLEDSRRANEDLNKIVSGTVLILVFIIWLIMLRMLTTGALVVIISQFAALTFIFGDAFKSVFQGIIFVSVMHPFDIGDRCLINGEEIMVEKINLLSTIFRKNMKDKIVYPNSVLIGMPIKNLDKGNRHLISDSFEITIDSSTTKEKIKHLNSVIKRFMAKGKHKDKWLPKPDFNMKEIEDQKLKIVLSVSYRKTDLLSDWKMMNSRRDILVRKLRNLLKQTEITYYNIVPKAVDGE